MTTDHSHPITVLVPLDGSSLALQAIPYASALVGDCGKLVFTTIVPVVEAQRDERGWALPLTEQDQDRVLTRAAEYLEQIAAQWTTERKPAHVVTVPGDPAEEIMRIAKEEGVDVIVMASHGRGAIGRLRFGSVADRISRHSEAPVLVIRPQDGDAEVEPGRIGRFIVALDGSDRAMKAFDTVQRLAKETGDSVHLISVIDAPDAMVVPSPWMGSAIAAYETGETLITLERRAVDSLTMLANQLTAAGIPTTFAVAVGDPFQIIDEAASPHDVIALATHGRTGMKRWTLGSLAEKLVRHAKAPVLIVNARS